MYFLVLSFISRDKFEAMIILIGLDNLDKLGNVTKRNISNVVIHEKFTSTAVRDENDIAIATLDYPVEFSDTVAPVCLPRPGMYKLHIYC